MVLHVDVVLLLHPVDRVALPLCSPRERAAPIVLGQMRQVLAEELHKLGNHRVQCGMLGRNLVIVAVGPCLIMCDTPSLGQEHVLVRVPRDEIEELLCLVRDRCIETLYRTFVGAPSQDVDGSSVQQA